MTTRRRSRLLTKIAISPRRRRDLEAAFHTDMRALRRRWTQPHPRESLEQFAERLFEQLHETLERYHDLGLFSVAPKASRRGRRPELTKEPKAGSGRPQDELAAHVAEIVRRDGRGIPDAAREVLRDDWKKRDPARYRILMQLAEDHRDHRKYALSPPRSLSRAFSARSSFAGKLAALIRTARNHLKNRER